VPEGHDATSARAALDLGTIQVYEMLQKAQNGITDTIHLEAPRHLLVHG